MLLLLLLTVLVTALQVPTRAMPSTTGNIYFYNAREVDTSKGTWQVPKNPPAQRCYSWPCNANELSFIKWNKMQKNAWLVFFDVAGCGGKYIRVRGSEGTLEPGDLGFDNRIASFMMWESGMYATRGKVDICYEDRSLDSEAGNYTGWTSDFDSSSNGEEDVFNMTTLASADYEVVVGEVQAADFALDF